MEIMRLQPEIKVGSSEMTPHHFSGMDVLSASRNLYPNTSRGIVEHVMNQRNIRMMQIYASNYRSMLMRSERKHQARNRKKCPNNNMPPKIELRPFVYRGASRGVENRIFKTSPGRYYSNFEDHSITPVGLPRFIHSIRQQSVCPNFPGTKVMTTSDYYNHVAPAAKQEEFYVPREIMKQARLSTLELNPVLDTQKFFCSLSVSVPPPTPSSSDDGYYSHFSPTNFQIPTEVYLGSGSGLVDPLDHDGQEKQDVEDDRLDEYLDLCLLNKYEECGIIMVHGEMSQPLRDYYALLGKKVEEKPDWGILEMFM